MNSRAALRRGLTSLIYRIVVHGSSRLDASANHALTFVANFPPCLQDASFSAPHVPLIPEAGVEADLFFPGGPADPRNRAPIAFRRKMVDFMRQYQPDARQIHQWPQNIET